MTAISIDRAQASLRQIILGLNPGEQLAIVDDDQQLATLTRVAETRWPCQAGSARHTRHSMAPDFDAPLEDFREYMQ